MEAMTMEQIEYDRNGVQNTKEVENDEAVTETMTTTMVPSRCCGAVCTTTTRGAAAVGGETEQYRYGVCIDHLI